MLNVCEKKNFDLYKARVFKVFFDISEISPIFYGRPTPLIKSTVVYKLQFCDID